MTTELHDIAFKAQSHPKHRFQNLYGLLNTDLLYQSWGQLNKQSAPGIDGITSSVYEAGLVENIQQLAEQLRQKRYRANAIKRVFIPKSNGKQRALGLPTLDDKVVQQSVSQILQNIWEHEFLPNSYGYRPKKSAHQAVHSLALNLQYKGYGYVVEADIKGFFDNMDHDWLVKMLEQRIDDKALIGLIKQWLKARVKYPDGQVNRTQAGTPQGGVISPVLANIYLHYVLGLWFEKQVKPSVEGRCMLVRYADDFVVAFQYHQDADRFYRTLPKRLNKFGLSVAADKTRMMRFNRFHPSRQRSFQFLGFEFYWDVDHNKEPRLRRRTAVKKQRSAMKELYQWIKQMRSTPLQDWMPSLRRKLTGFRNYFGLPDNSRSLERLYSHVLYSLFKWLNRRSQRRSYNWSGLKQMLNGFHIAPPKVAKRHILVDWY